ncbi:MAG: hypothetical protein MR008_01940 [Aerococcus sp.]|nr:hypothetical protein [Aerococcus sp.]
MILTLGAYAGAISAVISLMVTIYRLIAALNRLIQQIDTLNQSVHVLFDNQQKLANAIYSSQPEGPSYDLIPPIL